MTLPILYVGSKNYSSWSMRPWLALTWAGVAFEERLIHLGPRGASGANPEILAVSPTGAVPVLHLPEGAVIWDSLAICEWAAEEAPDAGLWPQDRLARAHARAVTAEMHAGFAALRRELPMNIRRRTPPRTPSPETAAQVARIETIWAERLAQSGGPFLTGARPGVADAFYAPVATRFRTYGVSLGAPALGYMAALFADRAFQDWEAAAMAETHAIAETDAA